MQITSSNAIYPYRYQTNNNLSFCKKTRIPEDIRIKHGKKAAELTQKAFINAPKGIKVKFEATTHNIIIKAKPGLYAFFEGNKQIEYPTKEKIKLLFEEDSATTAKKSSKKIKHPLKKIRKQIEKYIEYRKNPDIKTSKRVALYFESLLWSNKFEEIAQVDTHITLKQEKQLDEFCRDLVYAFIDLKNKINANIEGSTKKVKYKKPPDFNIFSK